MFVGYQRGEEDGIWKESHRMKLLMPAILANAYKEGEDAGIKEGYDAAMSIKNWDTNSPDENNTDEEPPALIETKSSKKFPCKNMSFVSKDNRRDYERFEQGLHSD
jgi:hypothetical protein